MKIKSEKGVTGIDVATGLIIFAISSVLVLNLYYQIYIITVSTKIHQVLVACITELCEKIDLETYEDITDVNVKKWANEIIGTYFNEEKNGSTVTCSVENYKDIASTEKDLVKEVKITITYSVSGNEVVFPVNKLKIKEG